MRSALLTLILAVLLLTVARHPSMQRIRTSIDESFLRHQAESWSVLGDQWANIQQLFTPAVASHARELERHNRSLQSHVLLLQESLSRAEQAIAATGSGSLVGVPTTLTKTLDSWAITSGKEDSIEPGDVVLESGAYIGVVETVFSTWSTLKTISDPDFVLTVQLSEGGEGVLTRTSDGLVLRSPDSLRLSASSSGVLTIPDPLRRGLRFPIGTRTPGKSEGNEMIVKQPVQPIGLLRLGSSVRVIGDTQ